MDPQQQSTKACFATTPVDDFLYAPSRRIADVEEYYFSVLGAFPRRQLPLFNKFPTA